MSRKIIICVVCGNKKPHAAYGMCSLCYGRMRRSDPIFKEQANEVSRKYYHDNLDEQKNRIHKYYEEHSDILKKNRRAHYKNNRDESLLYAVNYTRDNPEKIKEAKQKYLECHTFITFLGKDVLAPNTSKAPEGYVYHHTCYDHADPEANLVLLSRSSHAQGHALLRKLGIEIPHINETNL